MPSAIVLCAGFGTRLRPLTDELPKPLVPVGDRSILEHALDTLSRAGFREVVINVHHLPAAFRAAVARATVPVRVVVEADIRGTAGGVSGARQLLSHAPVLVWNGDIVVQPPLDLLLARSEPDTVCLAVAARPLGEGTVGLDELGRVVRLRGERFGVEVQGGDYVGVLTLGADVQQALPDRGCLIGDALLPRLRAGATVLSAPVTGAWSDAGDPPSLLAVNLAWLAERALESFVGEGAEVDAAVELQSALVGRGARVRGAGQLVRCVVCPGATATAPLEDAIVLPSGRVMRAHV